MRLAVPGQILMTRGAFDEARQYLRQRRRAPASAASAPASKTPAPVEPTPAPAPAEPETAEDPWHLGLEIGPRDEDEDDTPAARRRHAGVNAAPTQAQTPGSAHRPRPKRSWASTTFPPLEWIAHGRYLISGHDEPIEVFEVGVRGRSPLQPPPDGEKARRAVQRRRGADARLAAGGRAGDPPPPGLGARAQARRGRLRRGLARPRTRGPRTAASSSSASTPTACAASSAS